MLTRLITLIFGLIINAALFAAVQDTIIISGDEVVCERSKTFYSVAADSVDIEWSVTGSNYYLEVNNGVEVYWPSSGNGQVVARGVFSNGNRVNTSLDIQINSMPRASIIDDVGDAFTTEDDFNLDSLPKQDSLTNITCSPACEGNPALYRSQFSNGVNHFWQANDGVIIGSNNLSSVQVDWSATGSPGLQLFVSNNNGCVDSVEICISVFKKPIANFSAADGCIGGSIYFDNLSENGNKYKWDFGDGNTSNMKTPVHAYNQSGVHEVVLYVYNNSSCVDSIVKNLTISENFAPTINCVGAACVGSSVLYTTDAICSSFTWNVVGGTLTAGQGTKTIEVLWDQNVSKGTIELDVSGCDESICTVKTITSVALIQPDLPIHGEINPCGYPESTYSLDPIPGANYSWSVEGGYVVGRADASAVRIQWNNIGVGKVLVSYSNPTLDCSGTSELSVNVKQNNYLSAPYTVCAGQEFQANSNSSNSGNWSVTGGEIMSETPGASTIKAGYGERMIVNYENLDPNFCASTETRVITITPPVPSIDFLQGDSIACIDKAKRYESSFFDLNKYRVDWKVSGGSKIVSSGNYVDLKWSAGPKSLFANLISRENSQCRGDTVQLEVEEFTDFNYDFNIEGSYCTNTELFTTATIEGLPIKDLDVELEWSISPSNAATIMGGKYAKNSKLQLNFNSGTATIKLEVKACGSTVQTIEKQIEITKPLPATILVPDFCEGTSVEVSTNAAEIISWEFNGTEKPGQILNITSKGLIVLNYEDVQGCRSSTKHIVEPKPSPKVITKGIYSICEGYGVPSELFAVDGIGYTFSWSKNGVELPGENQAELGISDFGTYEVEVVSADNCTNSKVYSVYEVVCPKCISNSHVSFTMSQTCNSIEFTNTSSNDATNIKLDFGDGTEHTFTLQGEKVTHQYELKPGTYVAEITGDVPSVDAQGNPYVCHTYQNERFNIFIESDFRLTNKCSGLELFFEESSTWLSNNDITQWNWDFGDPASGANNTSLLQNPSHVFTAEGTYNVTLTVSNGSCSATYSKSIEVEKPVAAFEVDDPICMNTPFNVSLTDATVNSSLYHDFIIGVDTIKNSDDFKITLESAGTHLLELKSFNDLGCSSQNTISIEVNSPQNVASITAGGPLTICAGDSVMLTSSDALLYDWSNLASTKSIYAKQEGSYAVTLLDNLGCLQSAEPVKVEVNLKPKPFVFSTQAPGFCSSYNSVRVDLLTGDFSYRWFVDETLQSSTNYYFGSNLEGDFVSEITNNETGCVGVSDSYAVKKHPMSPINIVSDKGSEICNGERLTLTATSADNDVVFTWRHNNSHSASVNVGIGGEYMVTGENSYGCTSTAYYFVEVLAKPNGDDVMSGCFEVCDESSITLAGIVGYQNSWYKDNNGTWDFVGNGNTRNITETGSYRAIVSNNGRCADTSNVSFVMFEDCSVLIEQPILNVQLLDVCLGDSSHFIAQSNADILYLEFRKQGSTVFDELYQLSSNSFYEFPTATGYYRLHAVGSNGEAYSEEVLVNVIETKAGTIYSNKTHYCEGESIRLMLEDVEGDFITWEQLSDVTGAYISLNTNINPLSVLANGKDLNIRAKVQNASCPTVYAEINIPVDSLAMIYDFGATKDTLCLGDTTLISATILGDSLQWYCVRNGVDTLVKTSNGQVNYSSYVHQLKTKQDTIIIRAFSGVCQSVNDTIIVRSKYNFNPGDLFASKDPLAICIGSDIEIFRENGNTDDGYWMVESNGTSYTYGASNDSIYLHNVLNNTHVSWVMDRKECGADTISILISPQSESEINEFKASAYILCGPSEVELIAVDFHGDSISWEFLNEFGNYQTIALPNDTISFFTKTDTKYVLRVQSGDCAAVYDTIDVKMIDGFEYTVDKLLCETADSIHFDFTPSDNYSLELTVGSKDTLIELNSDNNYSIAVSEIGVYSFNILSGPCYFDMNDSSEVLALPVLELDTIISPTCFGMSDAKIVADVNTSSTYEVAFIWKDEASLTVVGNTPDITNIESGKYYAEAFYVDLPTCGSWDSVFIAQPGDIDTLLSIVVEESCESFKDGTLEMQFSGGTKPFQFELFMDGIDILPTKVELVSDSGFKAIDLKSGLINVLVTDAKGCSRQFDVIINGAPAIELGIQAITELICAYDSGGVVLELSSEIEGELLVVWPDGVQSTDLHRNDLLSGEGYVKVITEKNCVDSVYFRLDAPPIIEAKIDSINNTCIGESTGFISASATGGNGNLSFTWSNGVVGSQLSNLKADLYELTVTDENNCFVVVQDSVGERLKPVAEFEFTQPECGESLLDIKVNATVGDITLDVDNDDVDVDYKGNDVFGLSIFDFDAYPITGEINNDGCVTVISDTVVFRIQPKALFVLDESQGLFGFNYLFENQSEDADYYRWTFGGSADTNYKETPGIINLDIRNILNPKVCLDVGTLLGCEANFCLDLDVKNVKAQIFIPNSFTPNFDGTNDTFKPVFSGLIPSNYHFVIRNQWNQIMFETNDPDKGWDGTKNGKKLFIGSYTYSMQFTDELTGKDYEKYGVVLLIH